MTAKTGPRRPVKSPDPQPPQRSETSKQHLATAMEKLNEALILLEESATHLLCGELVGAETGKIYHLAHRDLEMLYELVDYQYRGNS